MTTTPPPPPAAQSELDGTEEQQPQEQQEQQAQNASFRARLRAAFTIAALYQSLPFCFIFFVSIMLSEFLKQRWNVKDDEWVKGAAIFGLCLFGVEFLLAVLMGVWACVRGHGGGECEASDKGDRATWEENVDKELRVPDVEMGLEAQQVASRPSATETTPLL
jgi:hypothetical protein